MFIGGNLGGPWRRAKAATSGIEATSATTISATTTAGSTTAASNRRSVVVALTWSAFAFCNIVGGSFVYAHDGHPFDLQVREQRRSPTASVHVTSPTSSTTSYTSGCRHVCEHDPNNLGCSCCDFYDYGECGSTTSTLPARADLVFAFEDEAIEVLALQFEATIKGPAQLVESPPGSPLCKFPPVFPAVRSFNSGRSLVSAMIAFSNFSNPLMICEITAPTYEAFESVTVDVTTTDAVDASSKITPLPPITTVLVTGLECGNGTVDTVLEECDAGGMTGHCDNDCTLAYCGDGTVNFSAWERCDDGNRTDTDACGLCGRMCGDVNGDNALLASDALRILQASVDPEIFCPNFVCDTVPNGQVLSSDALAVLERSVGFETDLGCRTPLAPPRSRAVAPR